jgi:hypothetical protein
VREHEVYSVVGGTPTTRRLAHTESQVLARDGGWLAAAGPFGLRRSALVAAPLAFLLIVGGGVAARSIMDPAAEPQAVAAAARAAEPARAAPAVQPVAEKPKPLPPKGVAAKPPPERKVAPEKKLFARLLERATGDETAPAQSKPPVVAAAATGRLELAVLPWGEVLVDGSSRGVSPPLRVLEIPAGSHTIELRNSTFPSRVEKVEVKPGEAVRIRHRFR